MPAKLALSPDLEPLVLGAIAAGTVPAEAVSMDELSKYGRAVLSAVNTLRAQGSAPPHDPAALVLMAAQVNGASTHDFKRFVGLVLASGSADAALVLQKLRERAVLLSLHNELTAQLAESRLDVSALLGKLDEAPRDTVAIRRLSESPLWGGAMPEGPGFPSLPDLTAATGGMYGLWAIGGPPGLGKSTLALQLAVESGLDIVLVDYENGEYRITYRLAQALGEPNARKVAERIIRLDTIDLVDVVLQQMPGKSVIVVDSLQSIPAGQDRRLGLDTWVLKFERLANKGHAVIMISEITKASFKSGAPSNEGFKETSEIPYKSSVGLQLVEGKTGGVDVYCTKNRDRGHLGLLVTLKRNHTKWWYEEVETYEGVC